MDLKQFITETIESIVNATTDLQQHYQGQSSGVIINPPVSSSHQLLFQEDSLAHSYRRIEVVVFDVAVSASEGTGSSGRAGLKIWSAEVGADGKKNSQSEEVSRVKFTIPIALSQSTAELVNRHREKALPQSHVPDGDFDPYRS